MQIKAAVLRQMNLPGPYAQSKPISIETIDLAPPGPGEVLVRIGAAGLCHSDLSVINGNRPRPMPMALGHEAAGIVEQLGDGRQHALELLVGYELGLGRGPLLRHLDGHLIDAAPDVAAASENLREASCTTSSARARSPIMPLA